MLKKFAATTSATALAIGMLAAGAGVAGAQEEGGDPAEGGTGSMSSGSLGLDFEEIGADLTLASKALNGPVSVTPGDEGTAIEYTNESDEDQKCGGMVFPYASLADTDVDLDNPLTLLGPIEEGGNVTIISNDGDGAPTAAPLEGALINALIPFALGTGGADVEAGDSVEWNVEAEGGPYAAAVICGSLEDINFGIDKQVVADQINDKLPGGSLSPVGPGSISGGSVDFGAMALGSLAGGDDEGEAPTDPEEPETPAE